MLDAGKQNADYMNGDEDQHRVDQTFMQLLNPLRAPEGIRRHHEPCDGNPDQQPQLSADI
jgi:hypothetical protein